MNIRTVKTQSSTWFFDLDLNRYLRLPNNEAPDSLSDVAYTGEWDDYERLEDMGDRVMVYRPVPFGTGAMRMTGTVIFDSAKDTNGSNQAEA